MTEAVARFGAKPAQPSGVDKTPTLNRVGLAQHQEQQGRKKPLMQVLMDNSENLEALLTSLPQIQTILADVRRGVRSRANSFTVRRFDTNSVPVTANGIQYKCSKENGNVPWDSFTIDSVGGAGTTMQVSINGSEWLPVSVNDYFDNLEIWDLAIRVTSAGAGTGIIVLTSYIPGMGGLRGVS